MNKFIVIAAVIAVVAGEAPPHVGLSGGYSSSGGSSGGSGINEYVDEALIARVGDLISRGGDGSGTPQGTEGLNLDSEILARVSGSLGDGASSGPSSSYGPPSRNGPAMLGNPEPAQRIAEFDLETLSSGSSGSQGGYNNGPSSGPSGPAPGPQYGAPVLGAAPSGGFGGNSGSGAISLGRPEPAQRVADFSLSGASAQGGQSSFSNNGGYN